MKKTFIIAIIIIVLVLIGLSAWRQFGAKETPQITNFAECVSAGYPAMESYPRQCSAEGQVYVEAVAPESPMSETEARAIAERECVKEGEALSSGYYNENSKTWWFDANLNAAQEGCNPACVVSAENKTAEINWRCTGLIVPKESAEEIQSLLAEKYPKYADTIAVSVDRETENHAGGSISFEPGAPGGLFLAAKIDGQWRIIFDGNGSIDCDKMRHEYMFPDEILRPNFCD